MSVMLLLCLDRSVILGCVVLSGSGWNKKLHLFSCFVLSLQNKSFRGEKNNQIHEESKLLSLLQQTVCDISRSEIPIGGARREFEVGSKKSTVENNVGRNRFVRPGVLVLLASTWLPGPLGRCWTGTRHAKECPLGVERDSRRQLTEKWANRPQKLNLGLQLALSWSRL